MRFRKNKTGKQQNRLDKQYIRKQLWKDPSIIDDIFPDQEWESHLGDADQFIPSTKMAHYIHDEISTESKQKQEKKNNNIYLKRFSYYAAAAALLLVSLGMWLWIKPAFDNNSPTLVEWQEKTDLKKDTSWVSVTNNQNSIQTYTLPDRSTVKLFAQSTIRYPQYFTDHSREIYLNGKAYFSVYKDGSRPFSVYASATKTTALGTSFTIDSRSSSKYISVQLHTGKIVVASIMAIPTFKNIFLKNAGESLSFDANMHLVAHHSGTVKKEASMSKSPSQNKPNGLLELNNIPLSEVFAALSTTYNTPIKIGKQDISKIQYTGSINPQLEQLQDVLAVICLINNLRYVQETDGSYTIYRQNEYSNDQL
ncbi:MULTISPECIES: FecR family protein [Sphingobacterium]|uniref:FecR family protein n=1 Tax=Sphingobacterium TaxID=28453 RepID=UPI00104815C3|nr:MULTISPECIES: FecR family protein [Sphingobacterium]MCW2259524.1 ferric-dicitrate binding protein FerR (iron transport regulator) [Sphingobacterium kitahiroshimense]TCR14030.1 FecR family protein [Sphingobacterium sp. JUb78]